MNIIDWNHLDKSISNIRYEYVHTATVNVALEMSDWIILPDLKGVSHSRFIVKYRIDEVTKVMEIFDCYPELIGEKIPQGKKMYIGQELSASLSRMETLSIATLNNGFRVNPDENNRYISL